MKTISVGFIGAGFAADLHVRALEKISGIDVRRAAVAGGRPERVAAFARRYEIPAVYPTYQELLADASIDVVCISVPNAMHAAVVVDAARAGKHVICEKPLTGAFGSSPLTGVERAIDEIDRARASLAEIAAAIEESGVLFLYAENWIYAPSMAKTKRLLELSRGAILDIRGEESHSGSHTAMSRRRQSAGGGSLLVLGSHPIAAAIHLKNYEATLRGIAPIGVTEVTANVAALYESDAVRSVGHDNRLVSDWTDVETWANTVMSFSDGSRAVITASFAMLGGVRNVLEVYTTNAVFKSNMTHGDSMKVFTPDATAFGTDHLHEKIESRTGWISASPDEDWERGYPQEMQDFIECVAEERQPLSDLRLARDVVEVIYASYLSAETGRTVEIGATN